MKLYPLKFNTIYKDKLWGGQKIKTVLEKDFGNLPNCGETWEISGVEGNISIVAEGQLQGQELKNLLAEFKGKLAGNTVYKKFKNEFPLLIKFIDANDDLSIQVHPGDQLAKERHNSFGKTEMWYVLQADEGAKLITGFNQAVDQDLYLKYFNAGRLNEILNEEHVSEGDVFYLPAGRVHTIGKGMMIAEIQQTSDITYRIYDFDRKDSQGNKRELHVEEALDAIDYQFYDEYKTHYKTEKNQATPLVKSPYFETNKISTAQPLKRDYQHLDSFVILICLQGNGILKTDDADDVPIKKGDSILIPACFTNVDILPEDGMDLLETYVP